MKKLLLFLSFVFLLSACTSQGRVADSSNSEIKPQQNDEGEWELHVLDANFDFFLSSVARPASQYSVESLKNRNINLVNEWNSYYMSGRYRNIIESSIQYDPNENYGKDFEYKLYQVFAFVNWQYGLRLNGLHGADAFRRR